MREERNDELERLRASLDAHEAVYEIVHHEKPIRSAREGAAFFGIEPGQTAPTLIGVAGDRVFALIVSGDYGRVDWELVKPLLEAETVRMATPAEVEAVTGSSIGSVSMVQAGLPVVLHRGLFRYDAVYGGTGQAGSTLRIRPKDLERISRVAGYLD